MNSFGAVLEEFEVEDAIQTALTGDTAMNSPPSAPTANSSVTVA